VSQNDPEYLNNAAIGKDLMSRNDAVSQNDVASQNDMASDNDMESHKKMASALNFDVCNK